VENHGHVPVMVGRCVELLAPALDRPGAVLVDATLGMGGHAEAVLRSCPGAILVGIDRDEEALTLASARLKGFGGRFIAHHAEYDDLDGALGLAGTPTADGVLFDLGVSSLQVDEDDRGFSYARDCPLDMRMDRTSDRTAADILNAAPEEELARILKEYGEERHAGRIARSIVRRRADRPLKRSSELVEVVRASIPGYQAQRGGNPAKRTFQALRIAVNDELSCLARALPQAVDALSVGGRIVVLSYHSLEDRMVKRVLGEGSKVRAPQGMPVVRDEDRPYLRLLTNGAEKAEPAEVESNPRSRPVRLRAAERIRETPDGRAAA
jgi:16S rRNA (cytosine1402-N4)-methyltransferase